MQQRKRPIHLTGPYAEHHPRHLPGSILAGADASEDLVDELAALVACCQRAADVQIEEDAPFLVANGRGLGEFQPRPPRPHFLPLD